MPPIMVTARQFGLAFGLLAGIAAAGKFRQLSVILLVFADHLADCPVCGPAWTKAREEGRLPVSQELCLSGRELLREQTQKALRLLD